MILRELRGNYRRRRFLVEIKANKITYLNPGKVGVGCCLGPCHSVIHSLLNHDRKVGRTLEILKRKFESELRSSPTSLKWRGTLVIQCVLLSGGNVVNK